LIQSKQQQGYTMSKELLKPKKLQPGDKIAAVTLSWGGPGAIPQRYQAGKRQLEEEFDLQVVEMPHTLSKPTWLRDHPQARADDLMQAFRDPTIRGIFSSIDGDDSIRILPYLDLDLMHANPKIFLGFSDTTVTHFACLKAGLGSFYGPSIMAGFAENGGLYPYMVESVRKTLFSSQPIGQIEPNTTGWTAEHLDWTDPQNQAIKRSLQPCNGWHFIQGSGTHRGRLIGGCLEVLDWLRGTPFWPEPEDWEGAILFIETSEDAPAPLAVSRMLRSLAAGGILSHLHGVFLGRPGGQVPIQQFIEYDQALLRVFAEEEGLTEIPVITGMDFGHTDPMLILPYGLEIEIDCDNYRIEILKNAVTD
jgi:muramoyltetrapeptide carboxypeptidase LdcA involved in peptidoglycan recycling